MACHCCEARAPTRDASWLARRRTSSYLERCGEIFGLQVASAMDFDLHAALHLVLVALVAEVLGIEDCLHTLL